MVTVPGALRLQRPHSDFFNAQDSLSTNVNGQSRLANNVQIEGIDDNHRTGLLTTLIPSAEAIETVNISTSAYDAGDIAHHNYRVNDAEVSLWKAIERRRGK